MSSRRVWLIRSHDSDDVCVCLSWEFIQSITKLARLLRRRRLMDTNQIVEMLFLESEQKISLRPDMRDG